MKWDSPEKQDESGCVRNQHLLEVPSQCLGLLHLLATVEEGCWISYFSCCCDKVSDKVQLKKEKVCFGS